jgi:hypothetical protein
MVYVSWGLAQMKSVSVLYPGSVGIPAVEIIAAALFPIPAQVEFLALKPRIIEVAI